MNELRGERYDGDEPDPAADTPEAGELRSSLEAPDSETFREDEEPLTRGEYADMMREEPAADEQEDPVDDDDGPEDPGEPDGVQDEAAISEVPEPRTRQEIAEESGPPGGETEAHPDDHGPDVDVDGVLAEQDRQPEPRTRQEAADDTPPDRPDPAATDEPTPEERQRLHEAYQDYLKEYGPESGSGWEQGANRVGDKPDRSPGDTSDLPPTGEQLLHMEDPDASRLEKLGNKIYEEFDDITDTAEKTADRVQQLLDRPSPTGHPEVQVPTRPYIAPTLEQHATPDAGSIAELGIVLGVVGSRAYQALRDKVTQRRRK
jgi:hypothetical protein